MHRMFVALIIALCLWFPSPAEAADMNAPEEDSLTANNYNRDRLASGDIGPQHITEMTEFWQRHHGLAVDGYCGPRTIASIEQGMYSNRCYPLRNLHDGREAVITSGFKTDNPSRPTHNGVDFFFQWLDSDPDVLVGDGGAIMRNGVRRWWYPDGYHAVAAASGVVSAVKRISTGNRVWIDHDDDDDLRSGYFHGADLFVQKGDHVAMGDPIFVVGDNPGVYDGKHLHFEISPVDYYAPMNPRLWLEHAVRLPAIAA